MRDFLWMVSGVVRSAPRVCALWLAASIVSGGLIPAQLWLTKTLVDTLAARLAAGAVDAPGDALGGGSIGLWLSLLAVVLVMERVINGSEPWLSAELREEAGTSVREGVMSRAAQLPAASFESQAYYDKLTRVMGDAEGRVPAAVGQVMAVVRVVPHLVGYGAGLFSVAPALLALAFFVWAPAMAVYFGTGKSHFALLREQTRDRRLAEYYSGYLRWRVSAKEVRLYQLRDHLLGQWERIFWETRNAQRALAFRQGLKQRGAILVSTTCVMLGTLGVISAGLGGGTPGTYALLFQSLFGFAQSMFTLVNRGKALAEQIEYAREYRAFVELPAETLAEVGAEERTGRPFPVPLREGIRFDGVTFTYPGGERPVLRDVTFRIRPGEKIALVGENGAGKSTLVKLLLGLYRPDTGRISVDGIDVREIELGSLRRAMSAVFQAFTRYQLTLAENVALGQPERAAEREWVMAAARLAGVDEFGASLPAGYDTVLTPEAGGVDLSGGQWQRVAVARAFFREAQVLVLDEPTAALDPLAELAVFEHFVQLAEGRTSVLISHRLGMARLADRVVVLREGRVVEDGHHDVLVIAGGEYAALFGAQARWYA